MQINPKQLFTIIAHNEIQEYELTVGAAVTMIRRHYCSQMSMNDLCTTHCQNCAARIQAATDGLKGAKSPNGLFAHQLRHQAANAADELDAQKKPEVARDQFGERDTSVDMFDALLADAL